MILFSNSFITRYEPKIAAAREAGDSEQERDLLLRLCQHTSSISHAEKLTNLVITQNNRIQNHTNLNEVIELLSQQYSIHKPEVLVLLIQCYYHLVQDYQQQPRIRPGFTDDDYRQLHVQLRLAWQQTLMFALEKPMIFFNVLSVKHINTPFLSKPRL